MKRSSIGETRATCGPFGSRGSQAEIVRGTPLPSQGGPLGGKLATALPARAAQGTEASFEGRPGAEARPRDRGDEGQRGEPDRLPTDDLAGLDPLSRSLWSLAPPEHRTFDQAIAAASVLAPVPSTTAAALDEILAKMVTRFALSGDRRRGTSHLVVGAGELAGGSVTLEAEGKAVHVRIDAPPGVDARAFGESIRTRLEARGLEPTIELR